MTSDDHLLDDVADAILDGAVIDWAEVESRAGANRTLLDRLKVLAALADVHRVSGAPARWGDLELVEPLGHGAFGRVFRARDTQLDREVALKLLEAVSPSGDARASSIVEEGRLLAQVRHPNVVTIYGAARFGNEVGLWMELVEGQTLEQLLDRGRRFTAVEAVEIGSQLCDAVTAVHAAGLLHRDIKAANVMLSESGRVVLMDFGTGWVATDSSHAVLAGTPLYLAPELLDGGQPAVCTDIYAIGVLLFHLLTSRYPVSVRVIDELKRAHASQERVALRTLRPDVPRALAAIVARAISPVSAHRYQTAAAMAAALRQVNRHPQKWLIAAVTIPVTAGVLLVGQALRPAASSPPSPVAGTPASAIMPVTSAPGEKSQPALSPDGSRVAYAWQRNGVWGTYVTDLGSGRTSQVKGLGRDASYPRWSPDGKSLAFFHPTPTSEGPQVVVRVTPLEEGESRTLWQASSQLMGLGLSWSPNGQQVALSVRPSIGLPLRIMLLDVSTLTPQWLTAPGSAAGDTLPAFSPDGVSLAFLRSAGSDSAIHIAQLATGEVRRVATGRHDVRDMSWSDEGRSLIFSSFHPGGKDRLWRVGISGGEPEPVAGVGEGARFPSAGAAGRMVYLQQVLDSNIYRAELAGTDAGVPLQLVASTRVESSPDISPDGSRIAFTSNRGGSNEVWLADADGANPKQLTALGTTAAPRWSPDGRQLACVVRSTASATSIHIVDSSTGATRRLTSGTAQENWPTWSADGRSIYFASKSSGSWQIWNIKATGGDPVQITHDGGLKAWESSDGSFVYFSRESADGSAIWRMSIPDGEPTLVHRFPRDTAWGGEWILKPEGIYWVNQHSASGVAIEFLTFATGRSAPAIVPGGRYDHGSGFSLSSDGRWAVFSQMDYHSTDIMMVEISSRR